MTAPITGRRRNSVQELELPGDFCFWHLSDDGKTGYMAFKCPCGADHGRSHDSIPVKHTDRLEEPYWKWDGNLDAPTLQPSILRLDACHWHGYLTGGVWNQWTGGNPE